MTIKPIVRWSVLWYSCNQRDGVIEYLLYENRSPVLFATRRECREEIAARYGYIKTRSDLRAEPHGWRLPKPIKVTITPEA